MKVFSITFQSLTQPDKFGMYLSIAPNLEEAYKEGFRRIIADQGDLMWKPIMQTFIDIHFQPMPNQSPVVPVAPMAKDELKTESLVETKSWIMKTIIDNKDKVLFKSAKKYLEKPEILFITDKIKE